MGQGQTTAAPPPAISSAKLMGDDAQAWAQFLANMHKLGMCVLRLDGGEKAKIASYMADASAFFDQKLDNKMKLQEVDDLLGQKNRGYVHVEGVKEFLKLKKIDKLPQIEGVASFTTHFNDISDCFLSIAKKAFLAMAHYKPEGAKEQFMKPDLEKTTLERLEKASSLSFIRYFPRPEPEARTAEEAQQPSSAGDEDGQNVPSKTHTDSGLITLILCNDVPGLQVQPHGSADFLNVEEQYAAHDHLFIIIGQKMALFAAEQESAFKPTVHKLNLPRQSYITVQFAASIRDYFSAWAPPLQENQEIWFETTQGIAIKWNYPVGVLFDVFVADELPWQLIVHFTAFPTDQVLKCQNIATVRSHFMNTLKQATYVKHNGIKVINDFSMKESTDVWEGFVTGNYDRFWSVNTKLTTNLLKVPIRLLRRGDKPFIQLASALKDEETNEPTTISTVLKQFLPEVLDEGGAGVKPEVRLLVQGISTPLATPLEWLSVNMAHPDGFLYIICA